MRFLSGLKPDQVLYSFPIYVSKVCRKEAPSVTLSRFVELRSWKTNRDKTVRWICPFQVILANYLQIIGYGRYSIAIVLSLQGATQVEEVRVVGVKLESYLNFRGSDIFPRIVLYFHIFLIGYDFQGSLEQDHRIIQ